MNLILSPIPQIPTWPFYGKALETISHLSQLSYPPIGIEKTIWNQKIIEDHRSLIERHLEEAKKVVALLESDLQVMSEAFPKEQDGLKEQDGE